MSLMLAIWPTGAFGHGNKIATDPKEGATLARAPETVTVMLTEAPAEGGVFTVLDGCGDTVSEDPQVDGEDLSTAITGGEPGRWEASYRVISSVDGHMTKDRFSFTVDGKKDCSPDEPKEAKNANGNGDGSGDGGQGGGGTARGPDDTDDGSSFPVVPVTAGTAVLVGLALLIRTRAAS
jgi:methionine-rich copper-binding protein CopC